MLIFNHPHIPSPSFVRVCSKEEIARTSAKEIPLFRFSFELLTFCKKNQVPCAVAIEEQKEAIYANALGARYILCDTLALAKRVQLLAEEYLFDSKIILFLDERLIDKAIEAHIDGVYLK